MTERYARDRAQRPDYHTSKEGLNAQDAEDAPRSSVARQKPERWRYFCAGRQWPPGPSSKPGLHSQVPNSVQRPQIDETRGSPLQVWSAPKVQGVRFPLGALATDAGSFALTGWEDPLQPSIEAMQEKAMRRSFVRAMVEKNAPRIARAPGRFDRLAITVAPSLAWARCGGGLPPPELKWGTLATCTERSNASVVR